MKDLTKLNARSLIRVWLSVWGVYFALGILNAFAQLNSYVLAGVLWIIFWSGVILTFPVFVAYYRGKATTSKFNPMWIVYTCIGAWGTYLLIIGSVRFTPFWQPIIFLMMLSRQIGALLVLPSLIVAFLGLGKQRTGKEKSVASSHLLLQIIATLVIATLSIGTYAAIRTLWISPEDGKFIYNNTANGAGIVGLALIALLSYLQRDIYWIGRGRSMKLDERELAERRYVFEISHKIGTALVFAALAIVFTHEHSIPTIVRHDSMTPGDMLWPFANLALTLFALPLVVAAYRKRKV